MNQWQECKLGDVAEITSSKRIFYSDYIHSGIPFWRSKEVIEQFNRHSISTSLFISHDKYNEIKEKYGVPKTDDILLTSVGTLGIPYLVKDNDCFYFKDGNLTWIRNINKQLLLPKFFYIWLSSQTGRDSLREITIGSTQEALTIVGLKGLDILLPPLSEQRAIATVLSSLDDKIDLLHRQNKTLEAMAETLFRQWFIEEADERWEEKPLSFYGNVICGKTPSKKVASYFNGDIPFIKIPDMHGNVFILDTADTLTNAGKQSQLNKTLPPKSICVSCIATVGLVSLNAKESQTNQQINSILPYEGYYRYFLYLFMRSSYDLLHAMASGGTATPNLNTGDFSKIPTIYPDKSVLENFHKIVEPLFDKILSNQFNVQTLCTLRDTLLPKLMSGEVRVAV